MTENKRLHPKESYNFGVDMKAERLYTKTSVDDIIGIVKTEEPTNSVTLKKEAQLSICEKRLMELEKENEQLKKELKRCKDWINSDKNDYELTLSFIKNKGYSLKEVLEYEKELKK